MMSDATNHDQCDLKSRETGGIICILPHVLVEKVSNNIHPVCRLFDTNNLVNCAQLSVQTPGFNEISQITIKVQR